MHIGRKFGLWEAIVWTSKDILIYALLASIPTLLFEIAGVRWLIVPWLPIALVGTAVAFVIGFKNNASYDRTWEARKIYGGIVNSSRTWGIMARDFVTNDHAKTKLSDTELKVIHQRLIYRHIAWMTALRHQLRIPKEWESMKHKKNKKYIKMLQIPEHLISIEDDLATHLSDEELKYVLSKKNRAAHILSLQSKDLKELMTKGLIEDFRHMELENMLKEFYTLQGKCERIKNFPYPRQFATINIYFVWLFIILLPFGMVQEFAKLGDTFVWLTIPFNVVVSWVFHTMEKIGGATENPFEGGANDIPISSMSRAIEIDLREMLDESDLPPNIEPRMDLLMI